MWISKQHKWEYIILASFYLENEKTSNIYLLNYIDAAFVIIKFLENEMGCFLFENKSNADFSLLTISDPLQVSDWFHICTND